MMGTLMFNPPTSDFVPENTKSGVFELKTINRTKMFLQV